MLRADAGRLRAFYGYALIGLMAAVVAGCGFHLRGTATFPPAMTQTYIKGPGGPPTALVGKLRQVLEINDVRVVNNQDEATAVIEIYGENLGRRTLAADSNGNAREYELRYSVDYAVKQSDGKELIQPNNLTVLRDLLYEEALVLGKAEGERLMIQNMVDDVAWSIVRRLQVIGS